MTESIGTGTQSGSRAYNCEKHGFCSVIQFTSSDDKKDRRVRGFCTECVGDLLAAKLPDLMPPKKD